MKTSELLLYAVPVLAVLAIYAFVKNAVPSAEAALNDSPAGQLATTIQTGAGYAQNALTATENYSIDPFNIFGNNTGN